MDYEFCKRALMEYGEMRPLFVIHGPEHTALYPAMWQSPEDKDRAAMLVRCIGVIYNAQCISFLVEAWSRRVRQLPGETADQLNERAQAVAPSEAEDRIEIVMVSTDYRDDAGELQALMTSGEIQRGADGKPSSVTQFDIDSEEGPIRYEGRFAKLLPPTPPTDAQREFAREVLTLLGGAKIANLYKH
jgi:hypothetical protein